MRRAASLLWAAVALAGIGTAQQVHAACLEEVRELADQHKLSTELPTATPQGGGVTSKELRDSGGVIKPPPMADRSVITPPRGSDERMQTMPDITPGPKQSPKDEAADQATLQAVLTAARAQAERGDEGQCLEQLAKARQLLRRAQ